jgi:pimeloyl-ACP methyl ester carboxylesterase/DNA-binding winged helix-turn-helix (wHTH) protein
VVRYLVGDAVIDTSRFLFERRGEAVHVQPQVFDVMSHLVEHRDRVVTKNELLDTIWGDRFVGESALTRRIKTARQLLGDDGISQSVIRTVHGRGYRWIADVTVDAAPTAPRAPAATSSPESDDRSSHQQQIRFCRTAEGARLAYATLGEGPPLVRAAHWITHLDYDFQSPVWRHWLEGLSRGRTLVRYDERGCGLSDHDPDDVSLEAFVHDLEVVVDEIGLERFPLIGLSQGGPVAVEYTRRHPERVTRLVLVNSYVRGRNHRAETEESRRHTEMQREMIRIGWGLDEHSFRLYFSSSFIPDASPDLWTDFAELLRRTTSAENALRIFDACADMDVAASAAELDLPTLIMHGRDELRIPFDESREYASLIRGSRLVPLDTRNHLIRPDEPAWEHLLRELDAFLSEPPESTGVERRSTSTG